MEEEIKIFGKLKSNRPFMGTLIVVVMLLIATTFFIGFVPEQTEAVYVDYVFYKEVVIESDYIDDTLTNFPILVHDDTGDLLGNVLANGSDIAFFASDNVTQFNHEIESYNSGTGELLAWVNVTSISDGTDTVFYMYYNDSDGIYPVGHNPEAVWSNLYSAVWHLNETAGTQYDATVGNHDSVALSLTAQGTATGKIDGADDFVPGSGNYINVSMYHPGETNKAATVEAWVRLDTTDTAAMRVVFDSWWAPGGFVIRVGDAKVNIVYQDDAGTQTIGGTSTFSTGCLTYIAITLENNVNIKQYINTTLDKTTSVVGNTLLWSGTQCTYIGNRRGVDRGFDGVIDEMRVSECARSHAWLNASFHSENETTGFLTLGSQKEGGGEIPSSYSIKGLPDDIITWSGVSGTTVWCNSSGDNNEWLEVNMSVNSTDNVTEIRVWVGDLNNSIDINATNITLWASDANNVTYCNFGQFEDGGSNISLNQTTWNLYAPALVNPFNGTGLTNTNESIFLIFSLDIPAITPTDIFCSSSFTAWKIYLGYYT